MKMIKSIMGRRQFLIAAGVTSTLGFFSRKLARAFNPEIQSGAARMSGVTASEVRPASYTSGAVDMKGGNSRYSHLLSPLKIRNKVLKNRMLIPEGYPNHQATENYPNEETRSVYARLAKNAAIVTANVAGIGYGIVDKQERLASVGDRAHLATWDTEDPAVENYVDELVEGIHNMGALVRMRMGPQGRTIDEIVENARYLETRGVDVVTMGGQNLKDEKSARLAIEQMQAVRKATNLLIMIRTEIKDPEYWPETIDYMAMNHHIIEEAIEIAKIYEDSADIMYFKVSSGIHNHPTGFVMEKGEPRAIYAAQAIKNSGTKIFTCPNGGFLEPDLNEEYIASGKTDMLGMCRAFISNWEYTQNLCEDRGEDIVPCIKCNKCHWPSFNGPWFSVCSVNPRIGTTTSLRVITPPTILKKVAVIGGGPAGMKAAITAAERGHKVTLYEKNDYLGGLMRQADFSPFTWPIKDFKDYLIRQMDKLGIEVILRTEATPDMIRAKGYDTVLAATGADPVKPKIPGADGSNVWNFFDVFANEKSLGKDVVFIGGGEFGGIQTGMFLANAGHNVTVLTPEKELYRIEQVHYPEGVTALYDLMRNYDYFTDVVVKSISGGKVTYVDGKGNEKSIQGDSVVIYAGLRARKDESLEFFGTAKQFITAGDCTERGGNIQKAIRSAFFAASQI